MLRGTLKKNSVDYYFNHRWKQNNYQPARLSQQHVVHATDSIRKANLLNTFFFIKQFSTPSEYKTEVNFNDDDYHNFRFDPNKVCNILKCIDVNKSPGPDNTAGIILTNCALCLSYPFSTLFGSPSALGNYRLTGRQKEN